MKKLLLVLIFLGLPYANIFENVDVGMDMGYFAPNNAFEMSMPLHNSKLKHQLFYGFHYFGGGESNLGRYESYTSTMGTVNTFGDRNDGLINEISFDGIGGLSRFKLRYSNNIIFNWGFLKYTKKF